MTAHWRLRRPRATERRKKDENVYPLRSGNEGRVRSASGVGIAVMESERFFAKGIGKMRAAVCMKCGEVSVYVDMEEIEKYLKKQ